MTMKSPALKGNPELVRALGAIVVLLAGYYILLQFISEESLLRFNITTLQTDLPQWTRKSHPWLRWDSGWYIEIAKNGYHFQTHHHNQQNVAFYPLYPLFIRGVHTLLGVSWDTAALVVSRLCTILYLLLLGIYAREFAPQRRFSVVPALALLAFPSAYILIAGYSESSYLLFSLAVFLCLTKKWYEGAGVAAVCAGLARVHGFALLPAILIWMVLQWREGNRSPRMVVPLIGAVTGALALPIYYWFQFGDPFLYFRTLENWGSRVSPLAVLDYFRMWVGFWMEGRLGPIDLTLYFLCGAVFLYTIVRLIQMRRWVEAGYLVGIYTLGIWSGQYLNIPRYTLLCFPFFAFFACPPKRPSGYTVYFVSAALLQGLLIIRYVNYLYPHP